MLRVEKTFEFIQRIDEAIDELAIEAVLHDVVKPLGLDAIFGGLVPTRITQPREIRSRTLLQRFPVEWGNHAA